MSVLFNLIFRFSAILIKISATYFVDIDKLILEFIWRGKRPRIANTVLKEKNKVGEPDSSNSVFLSQDCFGHSGSSVFPYEL